MSKVSLYSVGKKIEKKLLSNEKIQKHPFHFMDCKEGLKLSRNLFENDYQSKKLVIVVPTDTSKRTTAKIEERKFRKEVVAGWLGVSTQIGDTIYKSVSLKDLTSKDRTAVRLTKEMMKEYGYRK